MAPRPRARLPRTREAGAVPPPYDVHNFLHLLGIEIDEAAEDRLVGRFTVTHAPIAGRGILWAPVVAALPAAPCASAAARHGPEGPGGFPPVDPRPTSP